MRPAIVLVIVAALTVQVVAQSSAPSGAAATWWESLLLHASCDATAGTEVGACALGDIDGDGRLDLVLAYADGHDELLLGDGTGDFVLMPQSALAFDVLPSRDVALGDLDGDGLLDVVVAAGDRSRNAVYVHRVGEAALVRLADVAPHDPAVSDVASSYGVCLRDLDHDGRPDLVVDNVGEPDVSYLNASVRGSPAFRRVPEPTPQPVVVDVGDLETVDAPQSRPADDFVYLARGEAEFDFLKITNGAAQP